MNPFAAMFNTTVGSYGAAQNLNNMGLLGSLGNLTPWGAIANVGSSLLGGLFDSHNIKKQNQMQREMLEYQYSKNLEMWKMQNEYNTPLNQMKRFEQAGLNPNLMYGQGNNGNAASMPSYGSAPMRTYQNTGQMVNNMINNLLSMNLQKAQIRKINAEAGNAEAQRDNIVAQNANILAQLPILRNRASLVGYQADAAKWNSGFLEHIDQWRKNEYHAGFQKKMAEWDFQAYMARKRREFADDILEAEKKQWQLKPTMANLNMLKTYSQWQNLQLMGMLYDDQHQLNGINIQYLPTYMQNRNNLIGGQAALYGPIQGTGMVANMLRAITPFIKLFTK